MSEPKWTYHGNEEVAKILREATDDKIVELPGELFFEGILKLDKILDEANKPIDDEA